MGCVFGSISPLMDKATSEQEFSVLEPPNEDEGVSSAYHGWDVLLESVQCGAISPLRGSYILELWKSGGRLPRRQDIPPRAVHTVESLERLLSKCRHKWDLAQADELFGRLIIALSYRWLTASDPDPDGFHLEHVGRMVEYALQPAGHAMAGSVCSHLGEAPELALFWDWGVLHQGADRTDAQRALFRRGLARSRMGDYADAKADLRKANELDPKSKEVREAFDECKRAEAEAKAANKAFYAATGAASGGYEAPEPEPEPKPFVC